MKTAYWAFVRRYAGFAAREISASLSSAMSNASSGESGLTVAPLNWPHNHRALFLERKKRFPVQYPKLITGKRQPWLNLASPRISPAKLRNWLRFRARRSKQNSLPVNVVDSHLFGPRRRPSKIRWALFVHALLPLRKNPVAHYADAPGPTVSLDRVQMYFAYNNAYSTLIKGPARSGKLAVLRTWTPAFPSPLNGVTVPGAPAFVASTGELNHKPQW